MELARLQAELADRESTTHFARAGISLIAAVIFGGAAGKLCWDAKHFPYLGLVSAVLAVGLATYSVVQYLRGRRVLRLELAAFESLKALLHLLRMDDPSALLPQ